MSDQQQPAGWYPTGTPGEQRYWDGTQWTEHTAPTTQPGLATGPPGPSGPPPRPPAQRSMTNVLIPVGVCVVLALVLVIVGFVVASGGDDESADPPRTTRGSGEPDDTSDPRDPTTESSEGPADGPGSASDPLPLGETARVGDYDVTVVAVDFDATDEIRAVNEFNEPPTNDDYALVDIKVTYVGDEEGTPSSDLTATLNGGDGVQYEQFECGAVTPKGTDFTTLTNGGTNSFDLCWDYRAEAADGATMFLESFLDFDDEDRTYWAVS